MLPILRQGRRDADGTETLPLVDQHRHRIGLCDEVIQRLPIGEVGPAHFAHSLPNICTPEALEAALLRRYAPMFPLLSPQELLARGCAITSLVLDP